MGNDTERSASAVQRPVGESLWRRSWRSLCLVRFSVLDALAIALFSCAGAARVWIAAAMFALLIVLVALVRPGRCHE